MNLQPTKKNLSLVLRIPERIETENDWGSMMIAQFLIKISAFSM